MHRGDPFLVNIGGALRHNFRACFRPIIDQSIALLLVSVFRFTLCFVDKTLANTRHTCPVAVCILARRLRRGHSPVVASTSRVAKHSKHYHSSAAVGGRGGGLMRRPPLPAYLPTRHGQTSHDKRTRSSFGHHTREMKRSANSTGSHCPVVCRVSHTMATPPIRTLRSLCTFFLGGFVRTFFVQQHSAAAD